MVEQPLTGVALILRAVDLVIADVEAANGPDRDEDLAVLFRMRERFRLVSDESGDFSPG